MVRIHEKLRFCVLPRNLGDMMLEVTPQYDPYKDETQNKQTFLLLQVELETTPEVATLYLNA